MTTRAGAREILSLAVPAFFALVAQPLFLLADSALVGHVGTSELAGLGVASGALLSAVGVFVFIAYATTAVVGRRLGAGQRGRAVAAGLDGIWLSVILGAVTAGVVAASATWICRGLGASGETLTHAVTYLQISAIGLPAMLIALAGNGVCRGFQDTRTPLVVSVGGFSLNLLLNVWFILGLGWGIAGSAWGTVVAEWMMAVALTVVVLRVARRESAELRPDPRGILVAAGTGFPLLLRTVALRAGLLMTTWVAAGGGAVVLASHQVAMTVWSALAFALDALAIAGQAITGHRLGAGDTEGVRAATSTMVRWGVWGGAAMGLVLIALSGWLPSLFTTDASVRPMLTIALIAVGLGQALSGYVFVLDGVLIGAGDARWLAWAMSAAAVLYLPVVWLARQIVASEPSPMAAVAALWGGWSLFMAFRAVTLAVRHRSGQWLVTGDATGA